MKTRTTVKAGGMTTINHNEGMKVRTGMKGGKPVSHDLSTNHNESMKVKTGLKGGKRSEVKDSHDR